MRFILWAVLSLLAIGVIALLGMAVFTDLPAPTREISLPVTPR